MLGLQGNIRDYKDFCRGRASQEDLPREKNRSLQLGKGATWRAWLQTTSGIGADCTVVLPSLLGYDKAPAATERGARPWCRSRRSRGRAALAHSAALHGFIKKNTNF